MSGAQKKHGPKLHIHIVTLFPGMFEGPLTESILKRARQRGLIEISFTNPRDFASGRHGTVDDRPYGGGAGMVLMAEPLYQAIGKARKGRAKVVLLSPQGRTFTQKLAQELSRSRNLVLVCGHYEGVDERVLKFVDMELSLGDYILTGGEIPAMAVTDAIARLVPGVLAKQEAAAAESFSTDLLDYPQYTRPRSWRGKDVPAALLSGDHARIACFRREAALKATLAKRPELLKNGKIKKYLRRHHGS